MIWAIPCAAWLLTGNTDFLLGFKSVQVCSMAELPLNTITASKIAKTQNLVIIYIWAKQGYVHIYLKILEGYTPKYESGRHSEELFCFPFFSFFPLRFSFFPYNHQRLSVACP